MRDNDSVSIKNAECTRATAKAILCKVPSAAGGKEIWVPQSQVHDDSEVYGAGHKGTLVVTSWFAEQEGL